MSIGTAMVLIALGVFFYLKPAVFKVTAKWAAVAVLVGAVAVGGWFLYDQHHNKPSAIAADHITWDKDPVVLPGATPVCGPWFVYMKKEDRPEFCVARVNKDTGKVEVDLRVFDDKPTNGVSSK